MTKKERLFLVVSTVLALTFGVVPAANAMHIMEGALQLKYCIAWGIICVPFVIIGFLSIRKKVRENRRALPLLAICGAFIFVISSLKIPSVSGSSSHMTGTGLAAILFGPLTVVILGLIVLIFQAILLAHGGLTTLGANTFSMAIAGPFVSYGIFYLLSKTRINRKVSVFLAAFLGDLATYCVTAFQLAMAHNSATTFSTALKENLVIFAGTQIPLGIVEGILTVIMIIGLETYAAPELRAVGYLREKKEEPAEQDSADQASAQDGQDPQEQGAQQQEVPQNKTQEQEEQ